MTETTQPTTHKLRIKSNINTLMVAHEIPSVRELSRRVDYRFDTVRQLHNGTLLRIPVELLLRLCTLLECEVGDLIYAAIDDEEGTAKHEEKPREER